LKFSYKMSWVKKTLQILASLFVLVHLTLLSEGIPTYTTDNGIFQTELVTSENDATRRGIDFVAAQQLLFFPSPTKIGINKAEWFGRMQAAESKSVLGFKVQEYTTLELKPVLLNIVLNDIVQPKQHRV